MTAIQELDTVALRRPYGRWLAGTTGAVLDRLDETTALVELVGPDGASLDVLPVAVADLDLVATHPGDPHSPGPDQLAG